MDLNGIDLNLYKVFMTVAQCKNITKASNILYVSQPAISYSIKQLEGKVGCKLFIRSVSGVELTTEGVKLLYYVENAFSYLNIGNNIINEEKNLINGKISIGVPTHIGIYYVNKHIQKFNEKYPGIKFNIVSKSTNELIKMLEVNDIDIIVDSYPVDSNRNNLTYYDLGEIENCFVGNNKYQQTSNKIYSIKDLNRFPLLLPSKKTSTIKFLNELVPDTKDFEPIVEVSTTEVTLDLVLKGLGIGYFNKPAVIKYINNKQLFELPLNVELPKTKICLAYFENFITNAVRVFIEQVKTDNERNLNLQKKEIRLIVTQECPFNCYFCHKEGIKDIREEKLDLDDIIYMYKMFNRIIGTSKVHITGGEPLMYSRICELCSKLQEKGCYVSLTTNGYTLDKNFSIGNYINKINFSLHSMNKLEFEKNNAVKDSYNKVLSNISKYHSLFPMSDIGINIVYTKSLNSKETELSKLLSFSESIRASLKIIELYPTLSNDYTDINELEKYLKLQKFEKIGCDFRKVKFSKKNIDVYLTKCTCNVAEKTDNPSKECNENNDFYITLDGKINLCRKTNNYIDLSSAIKERDDVKMTELILEACNVLGNNCPMEK